MPLQLNIITDLMCRIGLKQMAVITSIRVWRLQAGVTQVAHVIRVQSVVIF